MLFSGGTLLTSLRHLQELDLVAERLKRRETKQAESEKDVRKAEQRIKIEHELAVLSILLKFAAYNDAHGQWVEARANKNLANDELKELQAANLPFEESQRYVITAHRLAESFADLFMYLPLDRALQSIVEHLGRTKQTSETKARKLDREIQKAQGSLEKVVCHPLRPPLILAWQSEILSHFCRLLTGGGRDPYQGEV